MTTTVLDEQVKVYLDRLKKAGLSVSFAVVYGPCVTGEEDCFGDIDTVVVSPEFDDGSRMENLESLWEHLEGCESPIEPYPCGEQEWSHTQASRIIDRARREGIRIEA
jgi:predicted nucleotidyltransferase